MNPSEQKHPVQSSLAPEAPPEEPDHIDIKEEKGQSPSSWHRFQHWYVSKKKITIPASVLVLLIVLGIIPWTRYHAAGLVVKKDYAIRVTDSASNTAVSSATVNIGSKTATTNAYGVAIVKNVPVGYQEAVVTKNYYKKQKVKVLVPIFGQKIPPLVSFEATGRQVKIVVSDLVNHQKVAGAEIEIAGTKAKTDLTGTAVVVLPAKSNSEKATISAKKYNESKVVVQSSSTIVKENDFKLTPSGKIYFLSKLSGKIDLVKTNLDGTERQTVLAGTGKEDDKNTILLAARDWNYLALLSNRDGTPKLFVINSDDDKLITMDQTNASFTPVGWHNHRFIYQVNRNGYNAWQASASSIKSYNADNGQLANLASTNASGSSNFDAQYETFPYALLMDDTVVFVRAWSKSNYSAPFDNKQNVLASIHADGTASKQIKTLDANDSYFGGVKLNKPDQLYFSVSTISSGTTSYFVLDKNGSISSNSSLKDQDIYSEATTYLYSPSGNQTFWNDERDGKQAMFIGSEEGDTGKQIATLSGYKTYGWYTDDYLLVSKNGSELYIVPVGGIKKDSEAIKISDYHKPSQTFYGYGGGYGGI